MSPNLQKCQLSTTMGYMHKRLFSPLGLLLVFALLLICWPSFASANTIQSTNYKLDESAIGVGDLNQSSSANFQGVSSSGDIAIGNSASSNYQINAGTPTTPDPTLSFAINNGTGSFDEFSPTAGATATASFSVLNYTSWGYVVQIFGSAPSYGSHSITSLATASSPQVGVEQFGINLVANTQPKSFGINPDNGQFGFGAVDSNYNTTNKFRYVSGDTIAYAPKSSGLTTYTLSYLVNVSSLTPGGQYSSNQTIIVTGSY
jgi:hypothetical protein